MGIGETVDNAKLVAIVGAVVSALATFLPWVTAGVSAGPVDVSTSAAGIDSTVGVVSLVVAVLVIAIAVVLDWDSRTAGATIAAGAVIVVIALLKLVDLDGLAAAGIGLYLSVIGGLAIAVGGLLALRENDPAR